MTDPSASAAHVREALLAGLQNFVNSADETRIRLCASILEAYVGLGAQRQFALVIPLARGAMGPGRSTEVLQLRPFDAVVFEFGGRVWTSPAAVLECSDSTLLDTFAVLAADVAGAVAAGGGPTWRAVSDAVRRWESLFRCVRRLSLNEELGLWGELWFITRGINIDAAVAGWIGPSGSPADFLLKGMGIECKTSTRRLSHHVSLRQLSRPLEPGPGYLLSIWVEVDPANGITLPALVRSVRLALSDVTEFERKLLEAGYSDRDANHYEMPYALIEEPFWFETSHVPKVRDVDEGVFDVRYRIMLRQEEAIDAAAREEIIARLWATSDIRLSATSGRPHQASFDERGTEE